MYFLGNNREVDVLVKALIRTILCLTVVLLLATNAIAQGSQLTLGPDLSYQQAISLEKGQAYELSFNLISDRSQSKAEVSIIFYQGNTVIDQTQAIHTLVDAGRSQRISLSIVTPEQFSKAVLSIVGEGNTRYWWDGFAISKREQNMDSVRQFWEEKLASGDQVYTGLVVDLRGLNANRGMSPRIFTESGQLIYGGFTASLDYIQSVGLVFYGKELTQELLNRIVADPGYPMAIPLVVKAVDVMEPGRINAIISDEDGAKILDALTAFDFLARFSVIFLVD